MGVLRDLITNAKKTLFIETYDFGNDSLGKMVTSLVCDAARRGVKVQFLADGIGGRAAGGDKLGKQMAAVGVQFRLWPTQVALQPDGHKSFNITHRKVYLADGYRGLTGGVNLKAPFDTTTHDLLVDFQGEEAQQLHGESGDPG